MTFFCSPQNFSIRSVATDKLDMTAIYSKWTFILLNRNRIFVILNHVSCDTSNPDEYPVKTPHYILVKPGKNAPLFFLRCFGGNQKPGISTALHYIYICLLNHVSDKKQYLMSLFISVFAGPCDGSEGQKWEIMDMKW